MYIYTYICIYSIIYILVGGICTPLKNMKVNGKGYPMYKMENKSHVPHHQPDIQNIPSGSLLLFNIAVENCPFVDGLHIENGDFL